MMRYNNHMGEETAFCQLEEILNIHIQAYYAIFENDYTKMEEYLEQFTEMDCYLVVLLRAVLSYKNKDYQKAEELLQRIQMEEEECFLAHYFLGKIAQENGKKEKAIIYYRQSLDSTCYMPLLEMSLNELKKLL